MYNSNDVADAIRFLSKQRGISVKKLLEDVGLGFNTMSNMKTSMPKADNLAKIADYLDCSVDFLLGRTDIPDINRKTKSIGLNFATYLENNDDEFDIAAKGKNLHTQKINRKGKTPEEIVKELNDSIENT